MADSRITNLTALTSIALVDLFAIVDDPSGTAQTKKIAYSDVIAGLTLLTALTAPALSDQLVIIDDPAGTPVVKKIALSDILLDEDDMATDSATQGSTQQAVKAYVDANAGGGGTDPAFTFMVMGA